MKLAVLTLVAVATTMSMVASSAQQPNQKDPDKPPKAVLQKFMRAKLAASNQIMEGLVTENFALITAGANKLSAVSADEKWRISNDAMYRQHSGEFRRIVERLQESAKQEDLDAAAIAWIAASMSCIECHKHVRAILIADR